MEKRILSWGLILSLLLTLLPVSAMATEGEVSGDGLSVTESTPCTCGAESDAEGIVTHAEGCPFAVQGDTTPGTEGSVTGTEEPTSEMEEPATGTEEPTSEMEEPVTGTEEPTSEMEEPVTGTEEPTPETEEPVTGTEEPTPETEKPVPGTEEPAPGTEEPVPGTEEPAPGTEESAPQLLTPPILTCEPLDEENSSDMVLTVEGEWDSYAWESCSYGSWSDWAGDGPNLILSKEEFTSYGFRCTVTQGEQLVTSEIFAYDLSVLERPMLMANGLADDSLSGSSDYIKFGKRLPNSTFFDIKGLDHGHEIRTTYADAGYRTAISVNGGTKMSVFYRGEPVSVGNSLTAETSLEIVYGGRYVKVNYEVTNNGSTTQNFRIGSSADVMIDNNDYAKVVGVKSSTGKYTGLSMSGSPKNNYQFSLIAPDCDTLWYGYYSKAYINIFNDLSNKDTPYSKDSGMAWSWDGTVAPGQTWSRYVFIGAGELPPVPDAPLTNAFPTLKAGEEFTISGMVSPSGNPPDTVHVSIGGEEYEAMVNEDGTFTVTGTLPENMPEGESVLTYWGTTDEGGISEIKSSSVTVVAAPYISLTTSSVTVMEGETGLNEAWLKAFIKSHSDTVNISPSNIDTNTPGEMTVTYKVEKDGFTPASAQLTVTVLPQPAELTQATVSESAPFVLTATMKYTGGLTYTATGFVYGAVQNPTLSLYDGKIPTDPLVDNKGGTISVSVADSALAYGVTYYARAYAISSDGTVIYSKQSAGFGKGIPSYGTFSVAYAGTIDNKTTFTITRTGGTDGKQTVYYRTINGSAIGETHFEHQAGSITFQEGETSKNIPVTEKSVTSIYDGNAATAYSNADRTYSLEIYRVVGGATINSSQKSASRTMVVSNSYYVDDDLFNVYQASAASGLTTRGDFDDDKLGWSDDEDIGAAASSTVNFSTLLPQREYWKTVAQELWYRFYMEAKEIDGGYQHIQFVSGDIIDSSFYPYEGSYKNNSDDQIVSSLNGDQYSALYAATFEHGGSGKANTSPADYYFPKGFGNNPSNCGMDEIYKSIAYSGTEDHLVIASRVDGMLDVGDMTLTVGFGGSGTSNDKWTSDQETHYFKLSDTTEPQLLGVAPMAGGSYLPGDSVTVALVFDEIVDSGNSRSISSVQVVTNWGTFNYSGGVNTNVLYFTGTVSQNATDSLVVQSIFNASYIKDMANDAGTNTSSTVSGGDTEANLGTGANAPAVTVSDITNTNGTLTGTVSTSTAGVKLEYVWSNSPTAPTNGWRVVASGSTVTTKQTSGTWYLYARATNSDGVTTNASSSYIFQDGTPVEPPNLTVAADNEKWAQKRDIIVGRSPADARVAVKTPGGTTETVSGGTYIATTNGIYIFTLESGDETITQMVTVSKLDTTDPIVEVVNLTNTNHTEAVILTVRASDGESGIGSVTGTWNNGSISVAAVFTSGNGAYTTTSPSQSGTWTLTATVMDNAGNTANDTSEEYSVNLSVPTIMVTQAGTDYGVTYDYTITPGHSAIASVQLPEGFALDETVTFPTSSPITGSLTFAQSGTYYIIVTDEAGHVVISDPMTVSILQDLLAPTVRLSAASNGAETLAIHISVLEEGGTVPSVAVEGGGNPDVSLIPDGDGVYTGTFTAATAGTYTVTATDAANNTGSAQITVYSVMFGGDGHAVPAQLVVSGDKVTKPSDPTRTGYSFDGWYSGSERYDFGAAVTADLNITAMWSVIPATAPTVSAGNDITQVYGTSDNSISVTAVAAGDATYTLGYQWYHNATNSNSGGTKLSAATMSRYTIPADTPVGTHYYYCEVTATREDNGEEITSASGVIVVTIRKATQEPPDTGVGYTINYIAETITVEDGYEVFTAQDNGTEIKSGDSITPGTTGYIRKQGSDSHDPSGWTPINIPARPVAPTGVIKTDETIKDKADGTVSGITTEMEYHIGDGVWKEGTDETLTRLSAGTMVAVRYPASETKFASEQTQVTVGGSQVTLSVTFQENGGTNARDEAGLSYGEKITAPTISRTGYTLDGWYNGEIKWDFEKDTVTSDLTLEARWTPDVYTITYDLNGGSLPDEVSNPESYTIESETFSLNNPTKPGYTFAGWTVGDETTPQTTVTILKGTIGSKEYTAHWTMDSFAVELTADKTSATYGQTITLTAVPNHAAGSVSYTYAWYKGGSATPISDARSSTLTLTDADDSGSYLVKVTAKDGSQNQTAASDAVEVTITPKEISAAWLGLDQVYGDQVEVQVKISGIVGGDEVSAKVTEAISAQAGSYALTATLLGDGSSNYTLKNSTATLTIQPKPVIFTVLDNTEQADGSEKHASISVDDTTCPYAVIYRQDGEEMSAPKQAGSYEIWVTITDSNYCHTNGSAEMQVGTLTITQVPPLVYTASFAGGESVAGTAPAPQTAITNSQITLPANSFNKESHLFIGWKADGDSTLYQPGDRFTIPAHDVIFTAQWQAVFAVDGTVMEKTDGGEVEVENAVVSLWLGANKLSEVTTGEDGTFQFENLVPGIYNLVVTKDVRTVTSKVVITTENKTCDAILPKGATNSIVKVTPGSPDIVVGDLDKVFEQPGGDMYTAADAQTVDAGGKVEITFIAEEKQKTEVIEDLDKIQAISNDRSLVLVMDYTLIKTVTEPNGDKGVPKSISQSNILLEILLPLPAQMQGKVSYSVFRVHDGQPQELKQGENNQNELGEYFTVSSDKTELTLHIRCFSTYAIGYTESTWNSGGGVSTPSYPPNVDRPDHGSVTINPSSPQKGDKVTITTIPEEGFAVDKVIITDRNGKLVETISKGDGTYTFTQPTGKVNITVAFRQLSSVSDCPRDESCPLALFTDADRNAWYHDGVHYCVENGLMVGTSQTTFSPNTATTRGMIVTILWRLEGSPIVGTHMDYDDVKAEDWYGEAIRWADSVDVVTGYGNGKFGPNDTITREQMAAILWRYAGSPDVEGSLSPFVDGEKTSSWAQQAMIWATKQGLMAGVGNNRLEPKGQTTRDQVATILMRFAQDTVR